MKIELTVNGQSHVVDCEERTLLADLLRDRLGLTGTHVGCDTSQCGCCTVHVDGQAVKSCTMLAVQAEGCEVRTIEDLSRDGRLHPVQQAFSACHALQCGFCTPGMVLAVKALLADNPNPTRAEIEQNLSSNLCRCTGYWNIIDAVERAAKRLQEGDQ